MTMDNLVKALEDIYCNYNIHHAILFYSDKEEFAHVEKELQARDFPLGVRLHSMHVDDDIFYCEVPWENVNVVFALSDEAYDLGQYYVERECPCPEDVMFFSL